MHQHHAINYLEIPCGYAKSQSNAGESAVYLHRT
jgi:hypothetical protein